MTISEDYDWVVRLARWRPEVWPKPPFGPTVVETLRTCALRRLFELSPGYSRRTHFNARIGAAFHRTIESLSRQQIASKSNSEVAKEVSRRFDHYIAEERNQMAARPRERGIPTDDGRLQRAKAAAIAEALRHSNMIQSRISRETKGPETEVAVQTDDGVFRGFVDRAEHRKDGTHIVDYKSALRSDLLERYERQLQMYAAMWADTRGDWPVRATVQYPLTGQSLDVTIDPAMCRQVVSESRWVIRHVLAAKTPEALASPGEVCRICEFRPWCQPFWDWQAGEIVDSVAFDRAHLGFEGQVVNIDRSETRVRADLSWRNRRVRLVMRPHRFPQFHSAEAGDTIRALDFGFEGMLTNPKSVPRDHSEIFIVN